MLLKKDYLIVILLLISVGCNQEENDRKAEKKNETETVVISTPTPTVINTPTPPVEVIVLEREEAIEEEVEPSSTPLAVSTFVPTPMPTIQTLTTPVFTPTPTSTPTFIDTGKEREEEMESASPIPTLNPTPTPKVQVMIEVVRETPTPVATPTPTPTPTSIETPTPTPTPTPPPIETPTPTPTPTPPPIETPTPTPTPTPIPIETPTPTPTSTEILPPDYQAKFINDVNCDEVLDNEFFLVCYDHKLKVAKSVAYTLAGDLVNELNIEKRPSFYEEKSIDEAYRATLDDYVGSGYDRGHLAPDASFDWSQESLEATYSLANVIPQVPAVNRYMWLKSENYEREKAVDFGEVTVVNVIKYSPSPLLMGEGNVSVSVGYYKMILNDSYAFEACYYYANDVNSSSDGDTLEIHKLDCSAVEN